MTDPFRNQFGGFLLRWCFPDFLATFFADFPLILHTLAFVRTLFDSAGKFSNFSTNSTIQKKSTGDPTKIRRRIAPRKSSCPAVLKINPKILRSQNQECHTFSEKHSPRMQCILKIHQILMMPRLVKPWPPSCFFLWLQFFISLSNFSEVTGLLASIMKAISSLFPFNLII
jgi:hypothetical protein